MMSHLDRYVLVGVLLLFAGLSPAADVQSLLERAEAGDAYAQAELGYRYHTGEGIEQDYSKAIQWYRLAAEQGQPYAQYNLGLAYAFGQGVEQDPAQAAEWYRKAAAQGQKVAAFSLGLAYLHGDGVEQNAAAAAKLFQQSANSGYARAQVHLGSLYHTGEGVPQNYEQAAYWYRQAAEQGNAVAQYNLANLYRTGSGVSQDDGEARRWFQAAADQGYAPAQKELQAEPTVTGDERVVSPPLPAEQPPGNDALPADDPLAGEEPGEESGKEPGFFGSLFGGGETRTEDAVVSNEEWVEPQAWDEQNKGKHASPIAEADAALARGDYQIALDLLQHKALNGNAAAETRLGDLYFQGVGVVQSRDRALLWYRRAAKRGYADAQFNLGNMYLLGEGVLPDSYKALDWYRKAAEQGHEAAQNNLESLERRLAEQRLYLPKTKPDAQDLEQAVENNQIPDSAAPATSADTNTDSQPQDQTEAATSSPTDGRIVTPPIKPIE